MQESEVPGVGSGRTDEYQVGVSGWWWLRSCQEWMCGNVFMWNTNVAPNSLCLNHSLALWWTFSSSLLPSDNLCAPLSARQAVLAVLLLKHRCSHLRRRQQRPRQDGHLKIWAGGHVGGKPAYSHLQPKNIELSSRYLITGLSHIPLLPPWGHIIYLSNTVFWQDIVKSNSYIYIQISSNDFLEISKRRI